MVVVFVSTSTKSNHSERLQEKAQAYENGDCNKEVGLAPLLVLVPTLCAQSVGTRVQSTPIRLPPPRGFLKNETDDRISAKARQNKEGDQKPDRHSGSAQQHENKGKKYQEN